MGPVTPIRRLGAVVLLVTLALTLGCRPMETPEELQSLAGDMAAEPTSPPASGSPGVADDSLDGFPLVGSVFPGLDGRLHSSFCDPASDPYSTCI